MPRFGEKNQRKLIDHSNITVERHLNHNGLHINKLGTSQLARNF